MAGGRLLDLLFLFYFLSGALALVSYYCLTLNLNLFTKGNISIITNKGSIYNLNLTISRVSTSITIIIIAEGDVDGGGGALLIANIKEAAGIQLFSVRTLHFSYLCGF